MTKYGDQIAPPGKPIDPLQIVRTLRWLGQLQQDEIVRAIQRAATADIATRWPELSPAEIEDMRGQCRAMTRSRLQAWLARRERQPTWLEVRGLIMGLDAILD